MKKDRDIWPVGINPGYLLMKHSNQQPKDLGRAIELCRNAGFSRFDYLSDVVRDDWRECALRERELFDRSGCLVHQSHCPFFHYDPEGVEKFLRYALRAVEAAAMLGADYLVVHADEYRVTDCYDPDAIRDWTCELLEPVVEAAQKHRIVLALENLFEDHCGPQVDGRTRYTGTVDELLAVLEYFDSPTVRCCWDFGHAQCSDAAAQPRALAKCGKYVVCTHVHDNYYGRDLHLPPYFGEVDWTEQMKMLRDFHYNGSLMLELVYGNIPEPLLPDYLAFTHKLAVFLSREAIKN